MLCTKGLFLCVRNEDLYFFLTIISDWSPGLCKSKAVYDFSHNLIKNRQVGVVKVPEQFLIRIPFRNLSRKDTYITVEMLFVSFPTFSVLFTKLSKTDIT